MSDFSQLDQILDRLPDNIRTLALLKASLTVKVHVASTGNLTS
jgi:hypothetical protein